MAVTSFNKANNSVSEQSSKSLKVPLSKHNRSRVVNGNIDIGEIKILDSLHTLPGERVNLNYLLDLRSRVPTVRKLKNGMKLEVYAVYSRWHDLYAGANPLVTKGRFGQNNLKFPSTHPWFKLVDNTGDYFLYEDTPMSLWDDIGLPKTTNFQSTAINRNYHKLPHGLLGSYDLLTHKRDSNSCFITQLTDGTNYDDFVGNKVNALDFFLYQKTYAYYECRSDLLKGDAFGQVDDPEVWRIPYNYDVSKDLHLFAYNQSTGSMDFEGDKWEEDDRVFTINGSGIESSFVNEEVSDYSTNSHNLSVPINFVVPSSVSSSTDKHYYSILTKRYAKYRSDLFTSASPFANMIRGQMPTLKDFCDDLNSEYYTETYDSDLDPTFAFSNSQLKLTNSNGQPNGNPYSLLTASVLDTVSMNTLRNLSMITHFMELNGRTDGSYNEMIKAQYDFDPQSHTGKPHYIGGDSAYIGFESIRQLGSTTSPDEYLGKTVSELNGRFSFNFGNFTAPDFGSILVLAKIVPDHSYIGQVPEEMVRLNQNEVFFPVLSGASPRGIKRRELSAQFDDTKDNEIIGYSDHWSFMRERGNLVTGLSSMGNLELFDSVQIMSRKFVGTNGYDLNMSNITCNPWTIDYSPFQDSNGVIFECDSANIVNVVNSVPYGQVSSYL